MTDAPFADDGARIHLDADGNPRIVERRFAVAEEYAGFRLDHFLKRMIPRLSRTRLQEIIRTQLERVAPPADGRPLKPSTPVAAGEAYVIRRPARPEPPCPRTFTVLYDDPHLMVIDKPAGLPVHISAKFYFNTLTRVLEERYPGQGLQICHRLDRETSGVLVVARGKAAAAALKGQFARHAVRKTYLAVARGRPPWPGQELIDLPLGLVDDPGALIGIRMEVRADALPARTLVEVRERRRDCALVACVPVTGRQHQIRAHLAVVGHPIVGDKLYGHGDRAFADYCERGLTDDLLARFELPRHALHAAAVRLRHPATGGELEVTSPLPADLRDYLDRQPA
jgi:23S rRNA pseudouridine1911/1915/1917 synthase